MPPKTVICSICEQIVPKSQTICIDPNTNPPKRACKSHDGVKQKVMDLKTIENKKKQKKLNEYLESQKNYQEVYFRAHGKYDQTQAGTQWLKNFQKKKEITDKLDEILSQNKCCICGESGRSLHEFKLEFLAAIQIVQHITPNFDITIDDRISVLGVFNKKLIEDKFIFTTEVNLQIIDGMQPELHNIYIEASKLWSNIPINICNHCSNKFERYLEYNSQTSVGEIISQTENELENQQKEILEMAKERYQNLIKNLKG